MVDAVEIMLGARPSTRSHVVIDEDLLQLFPRSDGIQGKAHEPVHCARREHDGEIIRHDTSISLGGSHSYGISL